MTTVSILLQQIKEQEERDLAYAKKIKEAEIQLKTEQDMLKKLKIQQKKLSEEIKRKYLSCSEKEITKVMLQHQKQVWEDLLQEAQRDLKENEVKSDELQQSVCLNRLTLYNDIKIFLDKDEITSSNIYSEKPSSSDLTVLKIKTEVDEDDYENLKQEMITLENQLEELKNEELQIEEAKKMKAHLEAEPSSGEEFLRVQRMLKETKDKLKKAEGEVVSLKIEIGKKELLILEKKNKTFGTTPFGSQDSEEKPDSQSQHNKPTNFDVSKSTEVQGCPRAVKNVTFKSTVEMKHISPPLKKSILKSKDRTKSPSPALRKKLSQQLSSELDKTMRDILFKETMQK